MVSVKECKVLNRHQGLSQSNFIGMNNPFVRANLNNIYAKNNGNIQSVLQFLKKYKENISGFDYRTLKGKAGNPTAILYMTSCMRYNLLRYGNIIFIDCQKRMYNKLNWPYIGPCIKNSDNRVRVTCEDIVTSKDIDTYT